MKVLSGGEMEELDRISIEGYGVPGLILMENAGLKVAEEVRGLLGMNRRGTKGIEVNILVGCGNNGGDGLVVGRHLMNHGLEVKIYVIGEKGKLKGDGRINLEILEKQGFFCREVSSMELWEGVRQEVLSGDYIIDGLFGIGLKGEVRGYYREVIRDLNGRREGVKLISIDVPSGLLNEDGVQNELIVNSDWTICIDFLKVGMVDYPGLEYTGEFLMVNIGFPKVLVDSLETRKHYLMKEEVQKILPGRFGNSHKGSYGHLLVIGGSFLYTGAPMLACEAGLRSGCGLVSLGSVKMVCDVWRNYFPEGLSIELSDSRFIEEECFDEILDINEYESVVIGPGLGRWGGSMDFLKRLILEYEGKLLIDGDGIFLLKRIQEILKESRAEVVITPHIKEMADFLGVGVEDFLKDKINATNEWVKDFKVSVVLKSAVTVIFDRFGDRYYHNGVNDGMATGGMGDVLSGMIGSFMAQGKSGIESALCGVFMHSLSGKLLIEGGVDKRSLIASDVIGNLGKAFKHLEQF